MKTLWRRWQQCRRRLRRQAVAAAIRTQPYTCERCGTVRTPASASDVRAYIDSRDWSVPAFFALTCMACGHSMIKTVYNPDREPTP